MRNIEIARECLAMAVNQNFDGALTTGDVLARAAKYYEFIMGEQGVGTVEQVDAPLVPFSGSAA